jgi:hypothetical protein
MGYIISHPKLVLEITLEEIKRLYIHEETIPKLVECLFNEFKQNNCKHPVIVDKETFVVLDGIHRIIALQRLGYKLVPVCLVNYNNPNITLGSWFRTIEIGTKRVENVLKSLRKLGYSLKKIKDNEMKKKIRDKEIIFGIVTSKKSYGIPGKIGSIKEVYENISQLERNLRSAGYTIGYETEGEAINKVKSNEALAAIIAPQITKREVILAALSGEKFIPKSTRHMIPARPLFVNVPIEWLVMDHKNANKLLHEHLSKKKLRHVLPGQKFDRRYEEDLYVFSDPKLNLDRL